jgi:hypothetical protein
MASRANSADIAMDATNLYHEESFTDRRVGAIQRLSPVTASGAPDESRAVVYVGQTQIMTPGGALPLNFEIPADSLEQAIAKFGECAEDALHSTLQRLEEMRREAASSLIVPGSGGAPSVGGKGGIQLP